MSELMTFSAIVDSIVDIFSNVKRQNEFCKSGKITANQFYFYSFMAQLWNNKPLEVYSDDLLPILDNFKDLTPLQVKRVIEEAIKAYLIREGQEQLLQSKIFSWRLV